MVTITRCKYPEKKLIGYHRKPSLVIVYIEHEHNAHYSSILSDWFFACNTDKEIIEHLKSENIDTSLFDYMLGA